jgi:hypothetical protein
VNSLLGWSASAVFAVSYFIRDSVRLRIVQSIAAVLWTLYGIVLHAPPIIVANIIVATLAIASAYRENLARNPSTQPD